MDSPYIRIEDTGEVVPLDANVTTVGRGSSVDVQLRDLSVSKLHAEIICRGSYAYVADLGLSRNGTRVNGRPAARRVLEDGDVLSFGSARCRVGGLAREDITAEVELRKQAAPELTRRELRRAQFAVPACPLGRGVRGPGHGPRDRDRPRRHRSRGQAAPAAPVPEVPHRRGLEPPDQAGQRGGRAGARPAAATTGPRRASGRRQAAGGSSSGPGRRDAFRRADRRGPTAGAGRASPRNPPPHGTRLPRGTPATNASPTAGQASAQPPNARAI